MLKNKKRIAALIMACLMTSAVLPGCASNQEPAKQGASSSSQEQVKLEFFQQKKEVVDVFNDLIADFEKVNPNIKIEQVNSPDAEKVLLTRVSNMDMPDLFTCVPVNTTYKKMMESGLITDITNESFVSKINPTVIKLSEYKDKLYALPMATTTYGLYYNKDLFDKNGLKAPTTIDELYSVCDKLKAAGVTPMAFYDKDAIGVGQQFERSIGVLNNDTNSVFKDFASGKGDPSEYLKNVANMMLKLRSYSDGNTLGTDATAATTEFTSGKAAMMISGTWLRADIIKQNANMNYELIPIPNVKAESTNLPINIDPAVAISKSTKHPAEAKKFLEFLASKEAGSKYAAVDASPTAISGVTSSVKEFKSMADKVNAGSIFLTPTSYWPSNLRSDIQPLLQQLIMDKDVTKFVNDSENVIKKDYK